MFGREPFLKCDAQLNLCSKYLDSHKSDRIVDRVEIARKVAKRNTERFQARQKQRFEESHPIVEFKVSDIVLHANFERVIGKVSKFLVKWTGPYRIIRKLGQLTYHIIKDDRATRVPRIIQAHARNLKIFHPSYRLCFNSEDENDCLPSLSNYDDNEQVDIISGVLSYVPRRRERLAREEIDSDEEFLSIASEVEVKEEVESELEEIVRERKI